METRRCILILVLLVFGAHAWQHTSPVELRQALSKRDVVLIAYVLPTQKASQDLEADWEVVRNSTQNDDVISVDCAAEAATCAEMDVMTYPAIRLHLPAGQIYRYRGPRRSSAILAFVRRASRPIISEIGTSAASEFVSSDEITLTAEYVPDDVSLYEGHYRELATQYHDRFSFAILPSAQQQSVVRCRNNLNDEDFVLKELWLVGALDELLKQCTRPLILEPTRKDIAELGQVAAQAGKHIIVHYFATSNRQKDHYREEMQALAKRYSNNVLFTIIDAQEHPMMPVMAGLGAGLISGISIEDLRSGDLFPYGGEEMSAVALEAFLRDVVKGAVAPWNGLQSPEVVHDEL